MVTLLPAVGAILAQADESAGDSEFFWPFFWLVVIGGALFVAWRDRRGKERTALADEGKNRALGGHAHRASGLNYLGGHPAHTELVPNATVAANDQVLAVETLSRVVFKVPMSTVLRLVIETDEEARRRFTATRMVFTGVFALAFPKRTPGSVLVTIETDDGPLLFEGPGKTKAQGLVELADLRTSIARWGRGPNTTTQVQALSTQQPNDPPSGDDVLLALERLHSLLQSGALTDQEFEVQKTRILGPVTPSSSVLGAPPPAPPAEPIPPPPGAPTSEG